MQVKEALPEGVALALSERLVLSLVSRWADVPRVAHAWAHSWIGYVENIADV